MAALEPEMDEHYQSSFVAEIRHTGGTISNGGTTVRLASVFGFCYGVQRALELAYAARRVFPKETIYLLGEIIHNPAVNSRLAAAGIRNLLSPGEPTRIEDLTPQDVVIVPAFGAEASRMKELETRGCRIVDTTCGDVMSVWKRVRQNAVRGVTTIIHGNVAHEETRATSSRSYGADGGHYLVVAGLTETDAVCAYIAGGGNRAEFLHRFQGAHSPGFDPELHLQVVGVANQTTMLSDETREVQRRLYASLVQRDGDGRNFQHFDGICRATQERQDALRRLVESKPDLILIVGGYNSSNTTHLVAIGESNLPTYFIAGSKCLQSPRSIRHFDLRLQREIVTEGWLPDGDLTVGVTAGASCPESLIEQTIARLFALRGIDCYASNTPGPTI